jgi:hypothetical protein
MSTQEMVYHTIVKPDKKFGIRQMEKSMYALLVLVLVVLLLELLDV